VVDASKNDFEESGVGQGTLNELQQVSDDTLTIPFASARRHPRIVVRKTKGGSIEMRLRRIQQRDSSVRHGHHISQTAGSQRPLSNRRSHSRQKQSGGSKIRPQGCPLLLHQRLKALCLRHSPTHPAALNRL
jgi:hypothetical protein